MKILKITIASVLLIFAVNLSSCSKRDCHKPHDGHGHNCDHHNDSSSGSSGTSGQSGT